MLAEAADACFYSGAADRMLDVADQLDALVGTEPRAPFYAAVVRGAALTLAGGDSVPHLRRAVELYDSAPMDDDPRTLSWASVGPMFLREADAGRNLITYAIARAREHAAIGVLPRLLNRLARDEAATDRGVALADRPPGNGAALHHGERFDADDAGSHKTRSARCPGVRDPDLSPRSRGCGRAPIVHLAR